ncbi:MAG: ribonuclease Y [Candidatus Kapabacteria bacterium]|nr:ribonuclease Y [Candidatus Kapabacteria bacterium]
MGSSIIFIIVGVIVWIAGFAFAYFIGGKMANQKISEAEQNAKLLLKDAEKDASNIKKEKLLEVKEEWHKKKQEFENEAQQRKQKMQQAEKELRSKTDSVNSKAEILAKQEKQLAEETSKLQNREKELDEKLAKADEVVKSHLETLEKISGMTKDEAKKSLYDAFIDDAKQDALQMMKIVRDEGKLNAHKEARNIIIDAIQRTASDHSVETTVSVVNLDSDEMKGRIIGREGRNIRAFESATGIDLIIDDTPEAVVISGFDPFRREVAKKSLEKLMTDGRIHPARIEEIVEKTKKELEEEIIRSGETTVLELGLNSVHPEILKLIGRMKYRSSYGQNLLNHSLEVAYLAEIMASELGLDAMIAKRAGLLHDIGKCVEQSIEGPHALLGANIAKKYKEHRVVVNAIGAHHEDMEADSPYAVLIQAADSISGARPGARRESLENYVKRLEKLETLANGFDGVAKTYAMQAGREIRVIVEPEKIDDLFADNMANEIAKHIENEMEYPGQIKVVVIRERRSVALAK